MISVESATLEEAYTKAAEILNCSVSCLYCEVVQRPSKGFLGFLQKTAKIRARIDPNSDCANKNQEITEKEVKETQQAQKPQEIKQKQKQKQKKQKKAQEFKKQEKSESETKFEPRSEARSEVGSKPIEPSAELRSEPKFEPRSEVKPEVRSEPKIEQRSEVKTEPRSEPKIEVRSEVKPEPKFEPRSEVKPEIRSEPKFEPRSEVKQFKKHQQIKHPRTQPPEVDINTAIVEIKQDLEKLFEHICFSIKLVSIKIYDEKTLEIKFDGDDAALLIGKDGYRYKALSYIIFNWINPKYGLLLRLEVAEFLKNQEEMISNYLEPLKEQIIQTGKAQTKILDGVLVQIALKNLRTTFPDRYVAIKSTKSGDKFVVVNNFFKSNE